MRQNLRESMEQLQFSENCREKMIAAMKRAEFEQKRKKNKVACKILLLQARRIAAAAIIAVVLSIVLSNDSIQAAIQSWYQKLSHSLNQNYRENLETYEQEIQYEGTAEGYTLRIYAMTFSNDTVMMEYTLTDAMGEAVPEQTLSPSVDVYSDTRGEMPDGGSTGETYYIRSEKEPQRQTAVFYQSGYVYKNVLGQTLHVRVEFPAGAEKSSLVFQFDLDLEQVYEGEIYPVDRTVVCSGREIYIKDIVDTGIFLSVTYEYPDKAAGEMLTLELSDGQKELNWLGTDGTGEPTVFTSRYDRSGFSGSRITVTPVLQEYDEEGINLQKEIRGESTDVLLSEIK